MRTEPHIIKGGIAVDDRGTVTFCNDFDMSEVKRFYMLENHEVGFVRAWHGHLREAKYVAVVSGVAIVGAVEMGLYGFNIETGADVFAISKGRSKAYRFVLHANGDVLYIPPGYANGAKNLVDGTRIMHFSTLSMNETINLGDDYRFDADLYSWIWEVKKR